MPEWKLKKVVEQVSKTRGTLAQDRGARGGSSISLDADHNYIISYWPNAPDYDALARLEGLHGN